MPLKLAGLIAVFSILSSAVVAQERPSSPDGIRLPMNVGGRTLRRMEGGTEQWVYQWPGVYFEARFKGDVVSLRFDDATSNFNVLVDNRTVRLLEKPGKITVVLDGLGAGIHSVRLEKRSETQASPAAFAGFFVAQKSDALPPPQPTRRIEFIGDSLTVGYGNTATSIQCTAEQAFEATDTQEAFGPLVAKFFHADYQVNAFSGIGLVRNYAGGQWSVGHLPDLWPRVLFGDSTPAPQWNPQVIVMGIGFNDFSPPFGTNEAWPTQEAMAADYERTYVDFVKRLKRTNPKALIVITWTKYYPPGYARSVQNVIDKLAAEGVSGIEPMVFPALQSTGCDQHPDARDDANIAAALEAVISAHPQVW